MKVRPNNANTEIPENLLNRELQLALKPFNLMQGALAASRYQIKNSFIIKNSFRYDVGSFFGSLILLSLFTYSKFKQPTGYIKIMHIIVFWSGIIINWYSNFKEKHNNVLIVIKMQKICRSLKFDVNDLRRFIFHNWLCSFVDIISFILLSSDFILVIGFAYIFHVMIIFCYALFDANMLYSASVITFLCISLKHWLENLQKLVYSEKQIQDRDWDRMFEVYIDILEVYQLSENTLGKQVS